MVWLMMPTCHVHVHFLNEGSIEDGNSSEICVWCMCVHAFFILKSLCIGCLFDLRKSLCMRSPKGLEQLICF